MKTNEVRLKIIRDTVANSIMPEMEIELKSRISDEKKALEMISLTRSELYIILNSFNEEELLLKGDVDSPEDFKNHILKVTQKAKQRLLVEMEKKEKATTV